MFGSFQSATEIIEVDSVVAGIKSMTEADIAQLDPVAVIGLVRSAMLAHNRAEQTVARLSRYRNLNPAMKRDQRRAASIIDVEKAAMQKLLTARR